MKPAAARTSFPGDFNRGIAGIGLALLVSTTAARAANDTPAGTNPPPAAAEQEAERLWSFSASAYAYFVPDSRDYVQPTVTADRGPWHFEARFNYEDLDTGSAWVGWNFSGGEKLAWEFTPMVGGVFGHSAGVAPGYRGSLGWWRLEFYSEGEYVFDARTSSDSFFYNWSELTIAPLDWLRLGVVTQRTRAYASEREVQRGFMAGFSWRRLDLAAYVFNPDDSRPTVVAALGVQF